MRAHVFCILLTCLLRGAGGWQSGTLFLPLPPLRVLRLRRGLPAARAGFRRDAQKKNMAASMR